MIWEASVWVFLFLTVLLGGGAAFLAGRAVALRWRPLRLAFIYMVLLAGAVRFLHFALFGGTLRSPHYYVVDLIVLTIISVLGYQLTRVRQMTTQYRWLYRRRGMLAWQAVDRPAQPAGKP
jgi:hypothetical protein